MLPNLMTLSGLTCNSRMRMTAEYDLLHELVKGRAYVLLFSYQLSRTAERAALTEFDVNITQGGGADWGNGFSNMLWHAAGKLRLFYRGM